MQKSTLKPDEATRILKEEHIARLTEDALRKLAEYTQNELRATTEDCQLLEAMNKMTKEKYAQMSQMSKRLMDEISKIQDTYTEFNTFIEKVDSIHQQTVELEKTARALDEYSKHLVETLNKTLSKSS